MSDIDNDTQTRTGFYRIIEKNAIGWQAEVELFDLISNVESAKDATIADLQERLDTVQADRESDADIGRRDDAWHAQQLASRDHRISDLEDRLVQLAAVEGAREGRHASELNAAHARFKQAADTTDQIVGALTAGLIDQVCELRADRDRLEARVADLEGERDAAAYTASLAALRERLTGGDTVK